MSHDVDVLVIGAGACGLSAAIAAHDGGASVAIVEKRDRPGGNSSLSTGSVPGAGSRFQAAAGIVDSPAQMIADLRRIAGDTEDPALLRRMSEVSAETVEWLVDRVEARMQLITAYKHIGHTVERLHAPKSRRGQDLVDDLLAAMAKRAIPLAVGNTVEDLIIENGRVAGAVVDTDGKKSRITARHIVLAVNGFAADRSLVQQYCPEIAGAQYFGALGSHGEAVRWGQKIDAALANMGAYQGYAAVAYPHGSLLSWTTIEKGGILIGADAKRFGDESLGYSGYARVVLGQGPFAFAVFDQRIFDIAALVRYGGVKKAETITELTALCEGDSATLQLTLDAYNSAARDDVSDIFGRRDFAHAPLAAPYYCCRVVPGLFHTQGGLKVDGNARVLNTAGVPIPGLFAGGGAAAGISGRAGALGYASGNGLLTAIALGRLAGMAAAQDCRDVAG
jgi:fumarate reductase flavoprotein subunit